MEQIIQDVRFGLRLLRRSPEFAIAALVCMTLGTGVTTTIFSAVNGILIRSLPFPNSDALVVIHSRNPQRGITDARVSTADSAAWRDGAHSFVDLGAWLSNFPTITGEGEPERIDGAMISANAFSILGVHPVMGREFQPAEEQPGNDHAIILSYDLWKRRYGGDPSILGRAIQLSGQPYEVVGVMPAQFSFPEGVQMWTPLAIPNDRSRDRICNGAIGRLKIGATLIQAGAEVDGISQRLQSEFPKANQGWGAVTVSLRDDLVGVLRKPILVFQAAAIVVLLIACANVANLMLARSATREREIAVRTAIGARRRRIFTQIVTESMALAVSGGVGGALVAFWGVRLLTLAFPDGVPSYIDMSVDERVLLFTILIGMFTGLFFGMTPAIRASRIELVSALREGSRNTGMSRLGSVVRNTLIVAEVALSLILIIAAALFARSNSTLERELGFQPHRLLSIRIPVPMPKYVGAKRDVFYDTLFSRIRALPGVQSVASAPVGIPLISALPYGRQLVQVEGHSETGSDESGAIVHEVTIDFFQTLGVPVVRGRAFTQDDLNSPNPAALINQAFAHRYFGDGDPVGQRVELGNESIAIVGVVRDFRQDRPPAPIAPAMYPYRPHYPGGQTLIVRAALDDPATLAPSIRAIVRDLDPTLVAYMVQSLDQAVERGLWRQRLQATVLEIFALLAVVLALFGIYGVISYTVAQRTREVGLRMALGATRRDVLALVIGQSAKLTLLGVMIGIVAAVGLTRFIETLLYGVRPTDLPTFAVSSALLLIVALLAAVLPARRASRVDPMAGLRAE